MALLEVRDLSFAYASAPHINRLKSVSFSVNRGEFITLCGPTGSGKSTLLRLLKRELQPLGNITGRIIFNGTDMASLSDAESATSIGFVCQRPEQQIVTDKVWHELAFGLENLGLPQDIIRRRTAEMAAYFGIEDWFDKRTDELSGGQKQLLNLASVMVMQPEVLLLDEPTSQLDPIAASSFISTVKRLNIDYSLTVIMIEHRLEEAIPVCDRLIALDGGKIYTDKPMNEAIGALLKHPIMNKALPAAPRLHSMLGSTLPCPVSVREGRAFVESYAENRTKALKKPDYVHSPSPALEFDSVCFRYSRDSEDVLRGLSLKVYEGEVFCLLGGNGSGKSTALSAASGLIKPYSGNIRIFGKKLHEYKNQSLYRNCLSLLPQDVQTVFLSNTVREELKGIDTADFPFDLSELYDSHPYDLSGGQQQLLALAKVLATKPRLLLLDEPTKGLDAEAKDVFASVIRKLRDSGITVIIVTHDAEFAAAVSDRCALFFRGEAISVSETSVFFSGNTFYTTAASRISRGYFDGISSVDQLCELCRINKR